ncbi:hypothetical protein M404DRAFT_968106 [Pisolithus tinctorius Marx 270]|uniref:Uncharacterized protein n=1 Tax=Pisolithus tinctorius Marx 270 TaxID=870435 RepID=A0A0C3INA9_PISTI|nr:hypothetical protein M404DRAFT_968106 [Pisolithus tinctorius Marx 270]
MDSGSQTGLSESSLLSNMHLSSQQTSGPTLSVVVKEIGLVLPRKSLSSTQNWMKRVEVMLPSLPA